MNRTILIRARVVIAVVLMGMFLLTGACLAAEFSASVTQKMTSKQMKGMNMDMSGKMYVKGIMQRQEISSPMGKQIMIMRPDKGLMWMITPANKTYTEIKTPKVDAKTKPTIESMIKKNPNLKKIGSEKISGYTCDKYKFTDKARNASGTIWISTKLQQEVKTSIQSPQGSMTMSLSNIKEAKQPDSLFTVPKGYKKQEMPKMPGGAPGMPGMPPMPPKK